MRRRTLPPRSVVFGVITAVSLAWLAPAGGVGWAGGAFATAVGAGGAAPASPATPATPVLSLRRVPGLITRWASDARLRTSLNAALADPALGAAAGHACVVVRQGSRRVYERRPTDQFIPASNMKLLVAAGALARLGPQTQLVTEARAAQPPANGVVAGPLWVVGGGDPLLDTNDFATTFTKADLLPPAVEPRPHTAYEALADRIRDAGIRQIQSGVVGDDSRYDTQRFIPTWKPAYAAAGEVGPMGALVVNDGFTRFAPRVAIAPAPAVHAADVLTSLLKARGISVGAPAGQGPAPKTATVVASLPSLPVSQIVSTMLRESDNDAAEDLVKEIGARFGGQGTTTAGLSVLRATLQSSRLPVEQYAAVDGSGLDRSDRASCAVVLDVLQATQPGDAIVAGLPVATRSGTLGRRFLGTPAAGRLRAKTGSLEGVVSLSGLVDEPNGGPLAFAMLVNDVSRDAVGRAAEDRVGVALARWPEVVLTPDLGPVGG